MIGGPVEPFDKDTFNRRYVEFRRPLKHQEALKIHTRRPDLDPTPLPVFSAQGQIGPSERGLRRSQPNMSGARTERRPSGGGIDGSPGGRAEEESLARPHMGRNLAP